ncbi:MAG: sulfatase-like hydrolase/transferase [Syntrophaceae bacterium]
MKKRRFYKLAPNRLTCLKKRHGGVLIFFATFLSFELAIRTAILVKAARDVAWDMSLPVAFGWGILYDIGTACWLSIPLIVFLTIIPERFFERPWGRVSMHAIVFPVIFLLLFGLAAEWVFWDEFGVRFNFIAIDYLVYTHEVVDNILESYPIPLLLGAIALFSLGIHLILWKTGLPRLWFAAAGEPAGRRYKNGVIWCMGVIAIGFIINQDWLPDFTNNYNRELGKNGVWSLFAAFTENELDFNQFFPTIPTDRAFQRMRTEVVEDGSILLRPQERDLLRFYCNKGSELKLNVIQITVESLSAEFLSNSGRYANLTPNVSALEPKSLVFDHFYATGTRTDRGMEALTLSIPPTPGRSLLKRPHNEGLFTLGSLFRAKGYDTAFIYSGYGYFDNMNYFFGNNGYRVIDRSSVNRDDITFANVWGACDEDLYRWTLREADAAFKTNKPFHFFVMTTSNHRPFTFPDGRIDLPSKISGRNGGIKYSDYAIGQFMREAGKRPWFKNTIFVIVADHCASSAGKTELPVEKYHIPLLIYAPGGQIPTGHIKTIASQIDYAPTLLGLLHWSYPSRFFGHDVLRIDPKEGHAIVGNYQKLGHIEEDEFVILKPVRQSVSYHYAFASQAMTAAPLNAEALEEIISYYQVANYLYRNVLYRALTPLEFNQYMQQGRAIIESQGDNSLVFSPN